MTFVYAHTASTLYRVDPDTLAITMVGNFRWSNGSDQMTDIAIDKTGLMIGVSFTAVYRIDPSTAQATRLSTGLSGTFNGLSFVPAEMLGQTGDDVLVGTRNSTTAMVFRIDPMTGQATAIGNMGAFSSSGDLVAVTGLRDRADRVQRARPAIAWSGSPRRRSPRRRSAPTSGSARSGASRSGRARSSASPAAGSS